MLYIVIVRIFPIVTVNERKTVAAV